MKSLYDRNNYNLQGTNCKKKKLLRACFDKRINFQRIHFIFKSFRRTLNWEILFNNTIT